MSLFVLAMAAGLGLLIVGAQLFVSGAAATARNLGVSTLIVGLTVVGFGTSAPELLVSATAASEGATGLAVGNAVGSNIANIGLVLGLSALFAPIAVRSNVLRREFPLLFAVMLVAVLLLLDHRLDRSDGWILIAGLGVFLYWVVSLGLRDRSDALGAEVDAELGPPRSMPRALFGVAVGLGILLLGSRLLVWGAVNTAQAVGVTDLVIGLTVVAVGTSLPEAATAVVSVLKGEHDIALGNAIGSNMFNLLGVLGIAGAVQDAAIDPTVLSRDFVTMTAFTIALFAMAYGFRGPGRINRLEGGALLAGYCAYLLMIYHNPLTAAAST